MGPSSTGPASLRAAKGTIQSFFSRAKSPTGHPAANPPMGSSKVSYLARSGSTKLGGATQGVPLSTRVQSCVAVARSTPAVSAFFSQRQGSKGSSASEATPSIGVKRAREREPSGALSARVGYALSSVTLNLWHLYLSSHPFLSALLSPASTRQQSLEKVSRQCAEAAKLKSLLSPTCDSATVYDSDDGEDGLAQDSPYDLSLSPPRTPAPTDLFGRCDSSQSTTQNGLD